MTEYMLANRKAELIFGLAILMACGVPAASMAHPIDLYPKLGGFALREPEMPTQPGAPQIYSTTNNAPNWLISQWKIAGPKLSAFTTQQEGDSSVYEANAPTASVRIVEAPTGSTITLGHIGAPVPCLNASGKPRESDLFLSSIKPMVGVIPGKTSGYLLPALNSLREVASVSVDAGPSTPTKGCKVSKGGAILAIILTDFAVAPHQVFFYQMSLSEYCRTDILGSVCAMPASRPTNYTNHNPFGSNDRLALLGQPPIQDGETRSLDIDLLPRLIMAIEDGPPAMDRDPANWAVTGGYFGLISWGDVTVTSTWQNYRLIADTN